MDVASFFVIEIAFPSRAVARMLLRTKPARPYRFNASTGNKVSEEGRE